MNYEPEIPSRGRSTLHAVLQRAAKHGPFEITMPTNTISEFGRHTIIDLMYDLRCPLPPSWSWDWMRQRGTYTGTFPKRVAKYAKKQYGVKLPNKALTHLGNIAKQHSGDKNRVIVDFTQKIDWHAGDFGDHRSCFWGSLVVAKMMLEQHRVFAMRFWRTKTEALDEAESSSVTTCDCPSCKNGARRDAWAVFMKGHSRCGLKFCGSEGLVGFGRTWLVPDVPKRMSAILMNTYPKGFQVSSVAQILASWLGVTYRKISLDNKKCDFLFINGKSGYVVENTTPLTRKSWEFGWDRPIVGKCYECEVELLAGDEIPVSKSELYCRACRSRYLIRCEFCHKWMRKDEPYGHLLQLQHQSVSIQYRRYLVCSTCEREEGYKCPICERLVRRDHTTNSVQYDSDGNPTSKMRVCFTCNETSEQNKRWSRSRRLQPNGADSLARSIIRTADGARNAEQAFSEYLTTLNLEGFSWEHTPANHTKEGD